MKKLIATMVTLLGFAFIATPALAYKGQNPCAFQRDTLQLAGYSTNTAYDLGTIQHLFSRIDVIPGTLSAVLPGHHYRLSFNCHVIHQTGRAEMAIVPLDPDPSHLITHVRWLVTKP